MRKTIGGDGSDTTGATAAYLLTSNEIRLANLVLIGKPEDPLAHWLTDWPSPLLWAPWGTFQPAVFKRGTISRKIGLEVDKLNFDWSPKVSALTTDVATASPYQRVDFGYYDNMDFRLWTVYMPTPGDCATYGASEEFGGRIQNCTKGRGKISLTINSFLDVVNQNVPTNVIELTNPLAAYSGAVPPFHNGSQLSSIPQFSIIAGSTPSALILQETTPTADQIFNDNELRGGFAYFNRGGSKTLGGIFSAIYANKTITIGGHNYNEVVLYAPLPWSPVAGVDTCFISGSFPLDQSIDPDQYFGFPFVPAPGAAI